MEGKKGVRDGVRNCALTHVTSPRPSCSSDIVISLLVAPVIEKEEELLVASMSYYCK